MLFAIERYPSVIGGYTGHTVSSADPLRPLWPFLGLLGSLIITFLFISGGALVDKIRGKQGVDDDDGKAVRLLVFGGSATRPACLPASVVLHLLHASSSSF